jgi:hypothetical protein
VMRRFVADMAKPQGNARAHPDMVVYQRVRLWKSVCVNNTPYLFSLRTTAYLRIFNMGRLPKRARHYKKMTRGRWQEGKALRAASVEEERGPPTDIPATSVEEERPPSPPIDTDDSRPRQLDKGKGRAVDQPDDMEEDRWFPTAERETLKTLFSPQQKLGGKCPLIS